jgi:hypothetical protein
MNIPIHFRVGARQYGAGYTVPYERGGPVTSIRLRVPIEKRFTPKFGKRIKSVPGGHYSNCRGGYDSQREVRFDWEGDTSEKLLHDILRFFEAEIDGGDMSPIEVTFNTDENGSYAVDVDKEGTTLQDLLKKAADHVEYLFHTDRTSARHFRTREEAEEFIEADKRQQEEQERKRQHANEVGKELLTAFNDAGFPCSSSMGFHFDVKTSKRLIAFLKEHTT